MIDDERLKTLKMVTDARESVDDALLTAKQHQVKPVKEVLHCLEQIEVNLDVAFVDASLTELEELQQRLLELIEHTDQDDPDLKEPVRKVRSAAKAIIATIEAARSVVTVPEKLQP